MAIEALEERETLNELAAKYELSLVMISRWKNEFLENSAAVFETLKSKVGIQKQCKILGLSHTARLIRQIA